MLKRWMSTATCADLLRRSLLVGAAGLLLLIATPVAADQGGVIEGKVDAALLAKSDVFVFLENVDGTFDPQQANMDQRNLKFVPHILPVLAGSTVTFKNSDDVNHNVFTPDGERYNLGAWGKGAEKPYTFTKPGVYAQLCNIHAEMEAYIVVLQNPFYSVVSKDGDGTFNLKGVPPGEYDLKIWGERLKKKELNATYKVKVEAGHTASVTLGPLARSGTKSK